MTRCYPYIILEHTSKKVPLPSSYNPHFTSNPYLHLYCFLLHSFGNLHSALRICLASRPFYHFILRKAIDRLPITTPVETACPSWCPASVEELRWKLLSPSKLQAYLHVCVMHGSLLTSCNTSTFSARHSKSMTTSTSRYCTLRFYNLDVEFSYYIRVPTCSLVRISRTSVSSLSLPKNLPKSVSVYSSLSRRIGA